MDKSRHPEVLVKTIVTTKSLFITKYVKRCLGNFWSFSEKYFVHFICNTIFQMFIETKKKLIDLFQGDLAKFVISPTQYFVINEISLMVFRTLLLNLLLDYYLKSKIARQQPKAAPVKDKVNLCFVNENIQSTYSKRNVLDLCQFQLQSS